MTRTTDSGGTGFWSDHKDILPALVAGVGVIVCLVFTV